MMKSSLSILSFLEVILVLCLSDFGVVFCLTQDHEDFMLFSFQSYILYLLTSNDFSRILCWPLLSKVSLNYYVSVKMQILVFFRKNIFLNFAYKYFYVPLFCFSSQGRIKYFACLLLFAICSSLFYVFLLFCFIFPFLISNLYGPNCAFSHAQSCLCFL